jgi:hypothetical protein
MGSVSGGRTTRPWHQLFEVPTQSRVIGSLLLMMKSEIPSNANSKLSNSQQKSETFCQYRSIYEKQDDDDDDSPSLSGSPPCWLGSVRRRRSSSMKDETTHGAVCLPAYISLYDCFAHNSMTLFLCCCFYVFKASSHSPRVMML